MALSIDRNGLIDSEIHLTAWMYGNKGSVLVVPGHHGQ
jgi:hypothetical protein